VEIASSVFSTAAASLKAGMMIDSDAGARNFSCGALGSIGAALWHIFLQL
jgi:hypothetical protein